MGKVIDFDDYKSKKHSQKGKSKGESAADKEQCAQDESRELKKSDENGAQQESSSALDDNGDVPSALDDDEAAEKNLQECFLWMLERMMYKEIVLWLHLELIPEGRPSYEREKDEVYRAKLFELAKAQEGISRDILVPGDMDLHALHYAITKLFGWRNGHLHRYCLGDDLFGKLTDGRVGGYEELCGVFFRATSETASDLTWDDDYEDYEDFDTWRKSKYTRPFRDYALSDTWFEASRSAKLIRARYSNTKDEDRIDEAPDTHFRFAVCKDLMESLTVGDILTVPGCTAWSKEEFYAWQRKLEEQREFLPKMLAFYKGGDEESEDDSLEAMAQELMDYRENIANLRSGIRQNEREYDTWIREQTGESAEGLLGYYLSEEADLIEECLPLFEQLKVRPEPFTDTLFYNYDFGDDWWVKITVQKVYTAVDHNYKDQNDDPVDEETKKQLRKVWEKGQPLCVAADGLNLVEDVGGIGGYIGFLETLKYGTAKEGKELRAWARSLGWTGRKKKPENML